MLFLLMNKDTKWLLFDCYEDEFGFVAGKEIESDTITLAIFLMHARHLSTGNTSQSY